MKASCLTSLASLRESVSDRYTKIMSSIGGHFFPFFDIATFFTFLCMHFGGKEVLATEFIGKEKERDVRWDTQESI